MNNWILLILLISPFSFGQSFAPAPGQLGSTAIHKDSSIIKAWATGVSIVRGPLDIMQPGAGNASFGIDANALFAAEGTSVDVVSLGDGGSAILTFDLPIQNGIGPDFAVFENGFADHYLELAFVEVSSDGVNYVRFPAISEIQTTTQVGPFEYTNCASVHNFAGKYRQGYGTPFDLEDLIDSLNIDLNNITHVKIIDVIGTIDPSYGSFDSNGTIINDLYPTAFESGGFDLDGVAILHPLNVSIKEVANTIQLYPNPFSKKLTVTTSEEGELKICSLDGKIITLERTTGIITLDLSALESGSYFVQFQTLSSTTTQSIIKH